MTEQPRGTRARVIENKRIVPRDLTMDEEAVSLGEILGIATLHRTFYRGKSSMGEYVFVYMAFPEGGPYEWLVKAAQRPQPALEVRSYDYYEGWRQITRYAFRQADKQVRNEIAAMQPQEGK